MFNQTIKSRSLFTEPRKPQPEKSVAKTKKAAKKKNSGFGGFSAGFLSGNSKPKPKKVDREEIEEIITPKARDQLKRDNPLVLPEVQEQMKKELADEEFLSSYGKFSKNYFG